MAEFTRKELDLLQEVGNEVAASTWRARYSREMPTNASRAKVKSFMEATYVQKKFYSETAAKKKKTSSGESLFVWFVVFLCSLVCCGFSVCRLLWVVLVLIVRSSSRSRDSL